MCLPLGTYFRIPGTTVQGSYDEYLTYDSNGNIQTLQRYGEVENTTYSMLIDDLLYEYDDGNKLLNVTDEEVHPSGFNDGNIHSQTQDDDFIYDVAGNLIEDRNKGITNISYNHLHQPMEIIVDRDTISYLYDAEGNKLQKQVMDGQTQATTDYLGGFQYLDGKLDFIPHAEGYVKAVHTGETTEYHYVYNYTDHLGNIRLSYGRDPETDEVAILKESHYYPFGLQHKGYVSTHQVFPDLIEAGKVELLPVRNYLDDSYRYTFGGKEEQPELGLNWMDFHARNYDAALGRWMNVDPMAEEMPSWSPYNYAFNNPVYFIDPDGMKPTPVQAASMAWHIYDGKQGQVVDGWTLSHIYLNDENLGYKAGLYTREVDGVMEYTMVNMGTIPGTSKENRESIAENFKQPLGKSDHMKLSLDQARKLSNILGPEADLTFVGHSKGGAEAAANAVATNRDAYVFNPAAVNLKAYELNSKDYSKSMTAFVVKGDPVAKTYSLLRAKPINKLIMLPRQSWTNPIDNHNNFGEALRQYLENNTIQD